MTWSKDLRTDAGRRERTTEITKDVTERLRSVCGHLPPSEFAALVEHIADVTVKYEGLTGLRTTLPPVILPEA